MKTGRRPLSRTRTLAAALVAGLALAAAPVPPPAATAAGATHHVVRPGQTLLGIARMHGLRYRDIAAWNGLRPPYRLFEDSALRLTRPAVRLPPFRTRVETVTPAMINWDPRRRCPVGPADLRRIWVSYLDFDGAYHDGSIIMHRRNVARTQRVFKRLYYTKFRIQAMAPVAVNAPRLTGYEAVTSGWQCRTVAGSKTLSQHAYGYAIDINPVQNPEIRGESIEPAGADGYVNRTLHRRGMLHGGGAAAAFTESGFSWGGRWNTLKDYMHFSTTNR
jgi:hypothetical protein